MKAKADARADANVYAHLVKPDKEAKRGQGKDECHCSADPRSLDENIWRELVESLTFKLERRLAHQNFFKLQAILIITR